MLLYQHLRLLYPPRQLHSHTELCTAEGVVTKKISSRALYQPLIIVDTIPEQERSWLDLCLANGIPSL